MSPTSRKLNASVALILSLAFGSVLVAATVLAAGRAPAAPAPPSLARYILAVEMAFDDSTLTVDSWTVDPATGRIYSVSNGHDVIAISTQPPITTKSVDLVNEIDHLALSPDGHRLYVNLKPMLDDQEQGILTVVATASMSVVDTFRFDCPDHVWSACGAQVLVAGPDDRLYLVTSDSPTIDIIDAETGNLLLAFDPPGDRPGQLAIHGDTLYTLSAGVVENTAVVRRFDISGPTPVFEDDSTLSYSVGQIIIAPDGSFLLLREAETANGVTLQVDAATLAVVRTFQAEGEHVYHASVIVSSDSQEIILHWGTTPLEMNHIIEARDADSGELLRLGFEQPNIHYNWPSRLVALPNNRIARLWNDRIHVLSPADYASTAPLVLANYCGGPFVDNFSNPDSGWPIADRGTVAYGYDRDQYFIQQRGAEQWSAVTRGDVWNKWSGAGIRVWVPAGQGAAGIVFGLNADWSEFYTLEYYILPQGAVWGVFHYRNGWHLLTNGGGTAGVNQSVQLGLEEYDDGTFAIRLDNRTVFTLPVAPAGRIGLSGASLAVPTELRYDDYYIFTGDNCVPTGGRAATFDSSPIIDRPPLDELLQDATPLP